MNEETLMYGLRKGKQTIWRRIISSFAARELRLFPIPGLDVLLAKGFNPHQKGVSMAATPRCANVLLATSPLPEKQAHQAAIAYAQMPRPRLLVFIEMNSISSLPSPDFILSLNEINLLHQSISFPEFWNEKAMPYVPAATNEKENIYTCPMHPEVKSNTPGNCPKCGMALVKKEAERQTESRQKNDASHQHHNQKKNHEHNKHQHEHEEHNDEKKDGGQEEHDMKGHNMGDMKDMEGGFMSMVKMTKDMPRSKDGLAMEMNDVCFGPFHPGLPGGLVVKMKLDGDTVMHAAIEKGASSQPFSQQLPIEPDKFLQHLANGNPLQHQTYKMLVHKALANAAGKKEFADEIIILEKDRILNHLNWLSIFSKTIGSDDLHYAAVGLTFALYENKAEQGEVLKLTKKVRKTLYLKKRLSSIGQIPGEFLQQISGPVAKAAGIGKDIRLSVPAYQQKNFKPVVMYENNAWGQLLVRLAETEQSIGLIGEENLKRKYALPEIESIDDKESKKGEATLESPNGKLNLQIEVTEGKIKSFSLHTANLALASLVPEITKGKEMADALVGIAALNLSPWERICSVERCAKANAEN